MPELQLFLDSPTGLAVKGLLVGTLLVFLLGLLAALRDGTFKLSLIDSFVRSTIWGRVAPVTVVLMAGYFLDPSGVLTLAGLTSAGAVTLGLIGAALDSIKQLTIPKADSLILNEPPKA